MLANAVLRFCLAQFYREIKFGSKFIFPALTLIMITRPVQKAIVKLKVEVEGVDHNDEK